MYFSDIHMHALYACDDGAKTREQMCQMLDAAYLEGTRYLCLTPHYHPGYFGENSQKAGEAYEALVAYAKETYPDLTLALGNELRFSAGCEVWVAEGKCRTMNGSQYVLVDFFGGEDKATIARALSRILNMGYVPILAHPERIPQLKGDLRFLKQLRDDGVLIQVNNGSLLGDFGLYPKSFSKKILQKGLADFVSSDAHGLTLRKPNMAEVYEYIRKRFGESYAEALCFENALAIIFKQSQGKEQK